MRCKLFLIFWIHRTCNNFYYFFVTHSGFLVCKKGPSAVQLSSPRTLPPCRNHLFKNGPSTNKTGDAPHFSHHTLVVAASPTIILIPRSIQIHSACVHGVVQIACTPLPSADCVEQVVQYHFVPRQVFTSMFGMLQHLHLVYLSQLRGDWSRLCIWFRVSTFSGK